MFWWFFELASCFKFLAVSGHENFTKSKRMYEFVLPGAITIVCVVAASVWPALVKVGFLSSFARDVFSFMVFVVPFHLAALGAFATFASPGLDEKLVGTNAQLRVWSNQDNDYFYKDLTLRQYVSLLFGYLCSTGIVYILIYMAASNVNGLKLFGKDFEEVDSVLSVLILFFVLHYVILTLYAVTFLFDKINRIRSV